MSQEPTVSTLSLRDLSAADYSFGQCKLPNHKSVHCLVVKFVGEADNSRAQRGTFAFMEAIVAAGIAAWDPAGVILDLENLKYEWGDQMQNALVVRHIPLAVIVSDMNRDGLTSLVKYGMESNPADILFESLAEAILSCDRRYNSGSLGDIFGSSTT